MTHGHLTLSSSRIRKDSADVPRGGLQLLWCGPEQPGPVLDRDLRTGIKKRRVGVDVEVSTKKIIATPVSIWLLEAGF